MKNIWKLMMIALMAIAMVGCPNGPTNNGEEGGSDEPTISWWEDSTTTNPGEPQAAKKFPYGFKFTTKKGWTNQYVAKGAVASSETVDKTTINATDNNEFEFEGPYDTVSADSDKKDYFADDSTKIFIDESGLTPGAFYDIVFNATEMKGSLSVSSATSKTNETADQTNDTDEQIYISGYDGSNWAGNDAIGSADKMSKDDNDEIYTFTFAAAMPTVNVTLKIAVDANTVLYLTNVPVKVDGSTVVDGSIYSWAGGSAVTVVAPAGQTSISGGEFEAAGSAENAAWAMGNFEDAGHTLAEFKAPGADDVLQLSIEGTEAFVPYIKGQTKTFSWVRAIAK